MTVAGLTGGLLTFTLAHSYADDWSEVVARLFDAFTLFDRRMSKWYRRVGCLGKLKALEAPVGAHGLHHFQLEPVRHVQEVHGFCPDIFPGGCVCHEIHMKDVADASSRLKVRARIPPGL